MQVQMTHMYDLGAVCSFKLAHAVARSEQLPCKAQRWDMDTAHGVLGLCCCKLPTCHFDSPLARFL